MKSVVGEIDLLLQPHDREGVGRIEHGQGKPRPGRLEEALEHEGREARSAHAHVHHVGEAGRPHLFGEPVSSAALPRIFSATSSHPRAPRIRSCSGRVALPEASILLPEARHDPLLFEALQTRLQTGRVEGDVPTAVSAHGRPLVLGYHLLPAQGKDLPVDPVRPSRLLHVCCGLIGLFSLSRPLGSSFLSNCRTFSRRRSKRAAPYVAGGQEGLHQVPGEGEARPPFPPGKNRFMSSSSTPWCAEKTS